MTVGSLGIASALAKDLSQPDIGSLWCRDIFSYLAARNSYCSAALSSHMSFLRDLPTLLTVLILSLTPALAYRQWRAIRVFLSDLVQNGLVFDEDKEQIAKLVIQANAFYRKWQNRVTVISFVSTILMCLVASGLAQSAAMFPPLQQSGQAIYYDQWWARIGSASWTLVMLWGALFIHVVLIQNLYGGRATYLVYQLGKQARLSFDPLALDGEFGWRSTFTILRCTWSTLLIHGMAMAMIGLIIPSAGLLYMLPLFAQWVIAMPIYIGVPLYVMWKNMVRWRKEYLENLEGRRRNIPAGNEKYTDDLAIANLLRASNQVSINPFRGILQRIAAVLSTVAAFSFIVTIIRVLYF